MKYRAGSLVLLISLLAISARNTYQVATGSISGRITDPMGAMVSDARVTLHRVHSKVQSDETVTRSDSEGRYIFKDLRDGVYDVWVEQSPSFAHETKVNITVGREDTLVDFTLRFAEGCDDTPEGPTAVTDVDKIEIVRLTLEDALIRKTIPDFEMLIKSQHDIVISAENIRPEWIPNVRGFKFKLMTPIQIQQKADRERDFLYLSFARFRTKGSCVAVTLVNGWAVGKKSGMGYLSGGGSMYEYHRQGAKWIGKMIGGWIS